jgi:3-oxoacyl-[acyl-carrier protein] reductase
MSGTGSLPLPAAISLQGRRVLVTGAANGIGRATAIALAQLGAEVIANDLAPLAGVRADLERAQANCIEAPGDLTADGFIQSLFAGGRIHAVAHCAGILAGKNWQNDPDWIERFHRVMDVNVRVPLTLAAAAIEHMAAHGGGSVVLVGSVAGRTGGTSDSTPPDYVASKGAVHALVKLLARQGVRRGVLVNAVAPGPVQTAMTSNASLPAERMPMGRMGRPEELAWPIAFLCSPAASYLSGAILDVNGGTFIG